MDYVLVPYEKDKENIMNKINLPNVDIISINSRNREDAVRAIKYCQRKINFGNSILITDIEPNCDYSGIDLILGHHLKNLQDYNDICFRLKEYTKNDYVLIVHDDGHIVNPDLWDNRFLDYDYIGAPWTIEDSWIQLDCNSTLRPELNNNLPKNRVGNGGFSLRSRKFLEFSSKYIGTKNYPEDMFLCVIKYDEAISYGIKYAPFDLAVKFSYETPCVDYDGNHWMQRIPFDPTKHFGWHGNWQFTNVKELLNLKNLPN